MSDLISREEAMVRIAKTPITEFFDEKGAINPIKVFNSMCRSLADTPTIEAEPKWIPCSERLPNNEDNVLVTAWDYVLLAWFDGERWHEIEYSFDDGDVVAWMPLPKPYERKEK